MSRVDFIAAVAPVAVKVRVDGGVLFPSVSIAQTILETGGKIHSWNNIVGYKVGSGKLTPYWHGRSVSTKTWEVYDGVRHDGVTANWRAYDTIEGCLKDQALLFLNNRGRYQRVLDAKTPEMQAAMLQECGYATDPQYAGKIMSLINQNELKRYDWEAQKMLERIAELEARIGALETRTAEVAPPDWAAPTVQKLTDAKLLADPNGDRSFHRTLVVLDRAGLFEGK